MIGFGLNYCQLEETQIFVFSAFRVTPGKGREHGVIQNIQIATLSGAATAAMLSRSMTVA